MNFIHDDFLLQSAAARRLYHGYAAAQPILDYHNHLSPREIAENRGFKNLHEIWLEGDHYKWRAMRAHGVPEAFCTGDAAPFDKFLAWAQTVPHTLRNPLYHWTHLEMARLFDFHELLNEDSAPRLWEQANTLLQNPEYSAQGLLQRFQVRALCTTDDPADTLEYHEKIAAQNRVGTFATRVFPTFRPDKALRVDDPPAWNAWLTNLEKIVGHGLENLDDLLRALQQRHDDFHALGGRLSDHGLNHAFADVPPHSEAAQTFLNARKGTAATSAEYSRFAAFLMLFFAQLDAEKNWTKQLHLGALRNPSTQRFQELGPDTGFDAIGGWPQVQALRDYLDALERENALPQMVIYNLNPNENDALATLCASFPEDGKIGKIQYGAAWWFLDQKHGIEAQLDALSNVGLLSHFIGMLTDSRSFLSFSRHEYFRRVLCNLLGGEMERGELPDDDALIGDMVRRICYANARDYLKLFED